ncbi:MAG: type II toxin-antitoxin system HicA family toxin [Clostridiales Family XIII bacterium]|jgi:predicted RNA binding protein YcfA (HicA-like mRNA interferase family)|nr:type II toxin-antitoxin system HicA family toxin [Clostridiales Family XIII bacterium]
MPKRYSSAELIRIIRKDGWYLVKVSGDHHKFKHPSKSGIVVLPHPLKDIPAGTAGAVLRQAGIKERT